MSESDDHTLESPPVSDVSQYQPKPADLRRRLEVVGISLVGFLGAFVIAFVVLDWLRHYPSLGALPGTLFDQFLIAGMWADHVLGTNVFQHPFMWRSIATGVLIGIVAPLVGTYLVHRQMALIGETLAHTAFAGVAIGLLVMAVTGYEGSLLLIALVVSIVGALVVQWLADRTSTFGDVPIAIMLSGSFAIGTLLISWGRGYVSVPIDIEEFLFGSMSVVTADGARMMAVLSVAVVGIVAATYKQLLFITFDEQAARVAQLDVSAYNTLLVVMTAVVVVGAMQVLGVILVAGMLVIPVAAASQVARSFRETLYLSILIGQASIVGGFAFAISQSLPSGGSIIVVAISFYLLAVAFSLFTGRSTAISMH
ncbi:metal ABC transporter permease [Natrarchaeobius chitinivorans]|uniref:Metal ABC transporter permease n=1 Tax=Natrarchaeobius chitinivorans TaxID=1679083 RepID=A0A3N6MKF6_NATCH|nr:metal ABC transporter permease [Natrarchaeobius chitinivorans]RQG97690.1 metal ABC transporter permease [Natrarchaeobius chitinivorans]